MLGLAEIDPLRSRMPQEGRAYTEKLTAKNALTDVGSFHPFSIADTSRPQRHGESRLSLGLSDYLSRAPCFIVTPSSEVAETLARLRSENAKPVFLLELGSFPALGSCGQAAVVAAKQISPRLNADAARRLRGHEEISKQVLSIIQQEAGRLKIDINQIIIRPAWSHEYEDRTGVVIEVSTRITTDQRFLLWDNISARLNDLLEIVHNEDRTFLTNDVSVVVTQG